MADNVTISQRQRSVLAVLVEAGGCDGFGYMSFDNIAKRSGLPREKVRAPVRALARKKLAVFGRGLWNDCGEPRGAGYAATAAGAQWMERNDG